LFTLGAINKEKLATALGGGIQLLFTRLPSSKRNALSLILYGASVAVLIAYSLGIHSLLDGSRLGYITACAVLLSDIVLFLFYRAEIVESPSLLSLSAVVNRALLFIFGG